MVTIYFFFWHCQLAWLCLQNTVACYNVYNQWYDLSTSSPLLLLSTLSTRACSAGLFFLNQFFCPLANTGLFLGLFSSKPEKRGVFFNDTRVNRLWLVGKLWNSGLGQKYSEKLTCSRNESPSDNLPENPWGKGREPERLKENGWEPSVEIQARAVPGQEGRLASRQIQAFIGSIVNKTLKILIHLDFKHRDEIYLRSRIMLVMAPQTFQLNVKTFAQLYQVKTQGAVDTTIFRQSILWQSWKNTEEGKGKIQPWAETQALAGKLHSQIIFTFISAPK